MRILEFIGYVVEAIALTIWRTRPVQWVRFWWITKSEDARDALTILAIVVIGILAGALKS